MHEYQSLSHTRWDRKYHVVFIPKCRRKALHGELRRHLGEVFKKAQKESRIEEGHFMPDHMHVMIATPPKYAVSEVVGHVKGKSAIHRARVYAERRKPRHAPSHAASRESFAGSRRRQESARPRSQGPRTSAVGKRRGKFSVDISLCSSRLCSE